MILPSIINQSRIHKGMQSSFGGIKHSIGAADGEIYDSCNLTAEHYPVLSTRRKIKNIGYRKLAEWMLYSDGDVYSVGITSTTSGFHRYFQIESSAASILLDIDYTQNYAAHLPTTHTTLSAIGGKIAIFPDKKLYNISSGTMESMGTTATFSTLQFMDGTIYGESAKANTIYKSGAAWGSSFAAGDAVTISGCSRTANNKTAIIREISGDYLRFSENCFDLGSATSITESGTLKLERSVPDLDYCFEHDNRLWGCKGKTIYCSKLGDPKNWNVFDGLGTDSWAVETGSSGSFTGGISYLGYPIFFKEDKIYKVYGSQPSNFELVSSACIGVKEGSWRSLAIAGNTLIYYSANGFMAYNGGQPQSIDVFDGERFTMAAGGSDGKTYYAICDGSALGTKLLSFDTASAQWNAIMPGDASSICQEDGHVHCACMAVCSMPNKAMISLNIKIAATGGRLDVFYETQSEELPNSTGWFCEFADCYENLMDRKGIMKLRMRMELPSGSSCTVSLQTDSSGQWVNIGSATGTDGKKRTYIFPILPRRCDHFRIRISGSGEARIYTIERQYYNGSEN